MKLRAGVLYAAGSAVTALKVDAVNYDSQSPWPLRFHDNQRTSNRMAPILNPPRLSPPPIPVPTPTPGPLCGGPPSYTPGPHVPTPGTYQTGVALGDFNEDGNQDILFSNETTNNVSLRLGDGNGNFSGSTNFSAPDHPGGSLPPTSITTGIWTTPLPVIIAAFHKCGSATARVASPQQ